MNLNKLRRRNMKKKLVVLLICALLYVGMYQTLSYVVSKEMRFVPVAAEGMVDFNGWDFDQAGPVLLKGEWEFYPNQLLKPTDFTHDQMEVSYVQVPNAWPTDNDEALTDFGQATYRLYINSDRGGEV